MRSAFFPWVLIGCFLMLSSPLPADMITHSVTNGLTVSLPESAGHAMPVIELLRRLDRVMRQSARLEHGKNSRTLAIELVETISAGTWQWKTAATGDTIQLPLEYANWVNFPLLGRQLFASFLQTRLGLNGARPLPESAQWAADALWSEFVQAERRKGEYLFRFSWYPALRNILLNGGKADLTLENLQAPAPIQPGSVSWELYCERAKLMLKIASKLESETAVNALQEYLFLATSQKIPQELCFRKTIGLAARKRAKLPVKSESTDISEKALEQQALEALALHNVFSIYVPLSAEAILRRLQSINEVPYRRSENGFQAVAALSDLPNLVTQYDYCKNLPREKAQEINQLTGIVPSEIMKPLLKLSDELTRIGTIPPEESTEAIKRQQQILEQRLLELARTEEILAECEKDTMPPLYFLHLVLDGPDRYGQTGLELRKVLDNAEQQLNGSQRQSPTSVNRAQ